MPPVSLSSVGLMRCTFLLLSLLGLIAVTVFSDLACPWYVAPDRFCRPRAHSWHLQAAAMLPLDSVSSCGPNKQLLTPAGATWDCGGWTRRWQPCRTCRRTRSGERRLPSSLLPLRAGPLFLPACPACPACRLALSVWSCSAAGPDSLPATLSHAGTHTSWIGTRRQPVRGRIRSRAARCSAAGTPRRGSVLCSCQQGTAPLASCLVAACRAAAHAPTLIKLPAPDIALLQASRLRRR